MIARFVGFCHDWLGIARWELRLLFVVVHHAAWFACAAVDLPAGSTAQYAFAGLGVLFPVDYLHVWWDRNGVPAVDRDHGHFATACAAAAVIVGVVSLDASGLFVASIAAGWLQVQIGTVDDPPPRKKSKIREACDRVAALAAAMAPRPAVPSGA